MSIKGIFHAAAFGVFFAAVMAEQNLKDHQIMQSPNELTVTAFEIEEEGLSVVLTNAIEDARALVEFTTELLDQRQRQWLTFTNAGKHKIAAVLQGRVDQAAQRQYQAMRVLGLLEAAREREVGGVV